MKIVPLLLWLWSLAIIPSQGLGLRPRSFSFLGLSNKFITPNGDTKNDNVVFFFSNPQASDVSIKIYDIRGRLVVDGLQPPTTPPPSPPAPLNCVNTGECQFWDAKVNGAVVAGGVYIYVIKAEDTVFSGTLVVLK